MTAYGYFLSSEEFSPAELLAQARSAEQVSHRGNHYTVENARLYTLPDEPPPLYVSGFGPQAAALAGRIGDGFVTMSPDAGLVGQFRRSGGGEKPQVLPTPAHFEQAGTLVTEEMVAENVVCGDSAAGHLGAVRAYADVGFDEVYVNQIGSDQQEFFDFYRTSVLPELRT